jgi:RNA polymerase sigma-70 factor (ECF subfamily)
MNDWEAIVAEHGPKVWRIAYRILADHADALDSYQETFLSAFRPPLRGPVLDWGAYLTTLAARRAIDRLRDRQRRRVLAIAIEQAPAPLARDPDPADAAAAAELMDRVRGTLAELPERQAEVFWLSCVEGLSHDRIAAQLGTTPGAVRVLVHRARAGLAAALNPTVNGRLNP